MHHRTFLLRTAKQYIFLIFSALRVNKIRTSSDSDPPVINDPVDAHDLEFLDVVLVVCLLAPGKHNKAHVQCMPDQGLILKEVF